jgi:hypothetical protein
MNSVGDHPQGAGFPHSEIYGSKGARPSPQLIAACYVLHRLSVPRHPPDALNTLDHHRVLHSMGSGQLLIRTFSSKFRHTQGQNPPCVTRACNPGMEPPSSKLSLAAVKTLTVMITSLAAGSARTSNRLSDENRRTKPMDLTDPSVHTYPQ